MIDYIIVAIVAAAFVFCVTRLVRRKRKGMSPCAGCSACPNSGSCQPSKDRASV